MKRPKPKKITKKERPCVLGSYDPETRTIRLAVPKKGDR